MGQLPMCAPAGVASSVVGGKEGYGYEQSSSIEIIKLGPAAINDGDVDGVARWGDYSASQVFADHMWWVVHARTHTAHRHTL